MGSLITESSSQEQKECVWGSYLSGCVSMPNAPGAACMAGFPLLGLKRTPDACNNS